MLFHLISFAHSLPFSQHADASAKRSVVVDATLLKCTSHYHCNERRCPNDSSVTYTFGAYVTETLSITEKEST